MKTTPSLVPGSNETTWPSSNIRRDAYDAGSVIEPETSFWRGEQLLCNDHLSTIDEFIEDLSIEFPGLENDLAESAKEYRKVYHPNEVSLMTLRLDRGLSQKQLAEMIGTKQPQIARLENAGDTGDGPSARTIKKLAKALNIDSGELYKIMTANMETE